MSRLTRGQALAETVLGLLVLITIITVGLHLSEVARVGVKNATLASTVLFDASVHSTRGNQAAPLATREDQYWRQSFRDLDARTSTFAGGDYRGVFTRANVSVATMTSAVNGQVNHPAPCVRPPLPESMPADLDEGFAMAAMPRLDVQSREMGFANDVRGFFKEQSIRVRTYPLCSAGRLSNGACSGRYQVLLDDWAMQKESNVDLWDRRDCALSSTTCANQKFFDTAKARHRVGDGSASNLARAVVGGSPANEDEFWMSYRDVSANFTENGFKTGPGPASRQPCYLGLRCP